MRSVLFAGSAERAALFERVMDEEGYAPIVRIVEAGVIDEAHLTTPGAGIVFVDLALGLDIACTLAAKLAAVPAEIPALIGVIGEPALADVDRLIAAGVNMYLFDEPQRLAVRLRFLRGAVTRRMGFAEVIEELRETKERYLRAEEEYLKILERSPDGVLIYRGQHILWANPRLAQLLGYDAPRELVGKTMLDLAPDPYRPIAEQRISERAAGHDIPSIEAPVKRRDGTQLPMLIVGMPGMFEGTPAVVVFARDLTERRALEAQLTAADRLASLGRLAASVGHEINNPLTYVMGNLELAMRELRKTGNDAVGEMLRDSLDGAARVQQIVSDLRVFSQRQTDALGPVDAGAVIDACIRMTSGELRYRARVVRAIDDVPAVLASEPRLAQVITNLLLNAGQAMPEGGADAHAITISMRDAGRQRVEIKIADDGPGIAPENLPHVFDPFFTTKSEHGGTGLGLSICKLLIASQSGELAIASAPGRGTTVTITLLIAPSIATSPRAQPRAPTNKPCRVLIVDDEPKIAQLLGDALRPHDVTIATSGREALALIDGGAVFDAIVCDLMMPEVGGVDVHEQLAVRHPGSERTMIFMTGGTFTPRVTSFLATVANRCLEKPFDVDELRAEIERIAAAG